MQDKVLLSLQIKSDVLIYKADDGKDCLKVLNECYDIIPRFVSHYMDEHPLVEFGNMDALALYSRMEQLSREGFCFERGPGGSDRCE